MPGTLINITLHRPVVLLNQLSELRKWQLSSGHAIRLGWIWNSTKSLVAIFRASEMAYLHRLYLNFMSTPKEKFNSLATVSEEVSNNFEFKLGGA